MSIVLVVVAAIDDVIVVRNANHLNVDDGNDDDNCCNFLRTFIRLFIFNICSLLSLIRRLFTGWPDVEPFESIFGECVRSRIDH